ncbi:hypothetical protein CEXT_676121 [Caerostris extrusa]|uniref:Uncharacterized protein n=1 Tax=Caerostris extrusa TaxID=172846 RepID=A0AAV4WSC3_CAEEX|nr:hypothetical protein CEXT_676121 [Caerostris extrusa]
MGVDVKACQTIPLICLLKRSQMSREQEMERRSTFPIPERKNGPLIILRHPVRSPFLLPGWKGGVQGNQIPFPLPSLRFRIPSLSLSREPQPIYSRIRTVGAGKAARTAHAFVGYHVPAIKMQ